MQFNYISKIKIQNYLASIFLIFSPILILLYEFNKKTHNKKILLLSLCLAFIYLSGKNNFSGETISFIYVIYILIIKFIWINFLSRNNIKERQIRILDISKILLIYIIFSFLITYFVHSNLVVERKLSLLIGGSIENSTNYINILIMLLVVLLFSNMRIFFFIISLFVFVLSLIWQNRTGIILTPIVVIFNLLINKKFLLCGGLLLFIVVNFSTFLSFSSRLSSLGLETERSIIVIDAFNSMISGEYFYGGYKVSSSILVAETNWTHNFILDTYRLSGIPGVIISIFLLLISFIKTIKRDTEMLLGIFCWMIGFLISMTSVVLESTLLEFLIIFILLFNFYFLNTRIDYNKQFSSIKFKII